MERILITGGSGFLGRGIMHYARRNDWKATFTVYSRDELKQDKCRQVFPDAKYVLGDICDLERLTLAMLGCDTVIHAAALKYIPEGEVNVSECIKVNINGAQAVIKAARAAGVKNVAAISTDKAVSPINVYGMSKAIMERLVGEAAERGSTKFTACRYGNVIGSTGSVIPLFQRQLKSQGFVTVTNPDMTRFWISVDEAVKLIVYALYSAPNGGVVIPEPRSMRIGDLAEAIAGDNVRIIGLRPGEKHHEDLLNAPEAVRSFKANECYYILLPPGSKPSNDLERVPNTLSSATPKSWITRDEMLRLISESETI